MEGMSRILKECASSSAIAPQAQQMPAPSERKWYKRDTSESRITSRSRNGKLKNPARLFALIPGKSHPDGGASSCSSLGRDSALSIRINLKRITSAIDTPESRGCATTIARYGGCETFLQRMPALPFLISRVAFRASIATFEKNIPLRKFAGQTCRCSWTADSRAGGEKSRRRTRRRE